MFNSIFLIESKIYLGITPFNFPAMIPLWMFPGINLIGIKFHAYFNAFKPYLKII